MADEFTINLKARFNNGVTDFTWNPAIDLLRDVAGEQHLWHRQNVGTSEEAIDLGDITIGGYFLAINRDATNYIKIRSGTGGTDMVRLLAGDVCLFRFDAGLSAPYAIADTAACELEYLILDL